MSNITGIKTPAIPEKAPVWKAFTPFASNTITKELESVKPSLNKVVKVLKATSKVIQSMKHVISLLQIFENLFKNLLFTFINAIADYFQQIIDNMKSTGVYILDLTTYHWTDASINSDIDDIDYLNIIKKGEWWTNTNKSQGVLSTTVAIAEDFGSDFAKVFNFFWKKKYKKETYNEFITTICEAFKDKDDVAPKDLITLAGQGKLDYTAPKFLQSGKPDFGPGSYMYVVLIVFVLPSIDELVNMMISLQSLITVTMLNDLANTGRAALQVVQGAKVSSNAGNILAGLNLNQDNKKGSFVRGTPPNFIGVNAYTIFAPVFNIIDKLILDLRSMAEMTVETNLLDLLNSMLDGIQKDIDTLLKIVVSIEQLITMIETILKITGIRILTFDTQSGIPGVIECLQNSRGFGDGKSIQQEKDIIIQDRLKVASYQKNLKSIQSKQTTANNHLTSLNKRLNNLNLIKTAVNNWHSFVIMQDLYTKEQILKNLITTYNNSITIQNNNISAIISAGNDYSGITKKITNLNNAWIITLTKYNNDIAAAQLAIDNLIAQQSDPTKPETANYTATLAQLQLNHDALVNERAAVLIQHGKDLDDLTIIQNTIYVNNPFHPLSTQLIDATNALAALKDLNNVLVNNTNPSAYYYSHLDSGYTNTISGYRQSIIDLDLATQNLQNLKMAKYSQIVLYGNGLLGINPDTVAPPPPTSPAPWTDNVYRDLYVNVSTGYQHYVAAIAANAVTRAGYVSSIEATKVLQADNLSTWGIFTANNIRQQNIQGNIIIVLNNEILKKTYNTNISDLTAAFNIEKGIQSNNILNIINNGFTQFLQPVDFRGSVLPQKDKTGQYEDWTGNEIGYMIIQENYNYKEPQFNTDNKCGAIEDAILLVQNEMPLAQSEVESLNSQYKNIVENETKRVAVKMQKDNISWSPTEKLCYGGVLLTFGFPVYNKETVFNIADIYKNTFNNPLVKSSKQLDKSISQEDVTKKLRKLLDGFSK